MTDTIPLIIQNCPASFRSTVRHAIGMLSAIRPESRPSWAGARTFRARSTTAFFSAANSAWKSSGPRYAFISSSMTSCLIFFSVIPSSVTHGMTPHTKSQIGPPLPDSLKDQERIADRIEKVAIETRSLESIYRRKLAALAELKQSLLHQAFAGQL